MKLKTLEQKFTICKVADLEQINFGDPFCFISKTDEELSLVCETSCVPTETISREDGWKAFRIEGILDFSLIGILSKISTILANNQIGIFVVSTYNTDYVLIKENKFNQAIQHLKESGYEVE